MHLIFDLDGTLIDSRSGIVGSLDYATQKVLGEKFDLCESKIGPPISEMIGDIFPSLGLSQTSEIIDMFRFHYDSEGWKGYSTYPHVMDTLDVLSSKKYTFSIATNKPLIPANKILKDAHMSSLFKQVLCFDRKLYKSKSSMVGELVEFSKSDCIMIGDSYDDFKAANDNGIEFVQCEYGYGKINSNVDKKIDCFHRLLEKI